MKSTEIWSLENICSSRMGTVDFEPVNVILRSVGALYPVKFTLVHYVVCVH